MPEVMKTTDYVVMEVYIHEVSPSGRKFWEMCEVMASYGLRPFDLADPMARALDGSLSQMDIFFARDSHSLFSKPVYA